MVPRNYPELVAANRRAFASALALREFRVAEGWLDPGERAITEAYAPEPPAVPAGPGTPTPPLASGITNAAAPVVGTPATTPAAATSEPAAAGTNALPKRGLWHFFDESDHSVPRDLHNSLR